MIGDALRELRELRVRVLTLEEALRLALPHLVEYEAEYPGDGSPEALAAVRAALGTQFTASVSESVKENATSE